MTKATDIQIQQSPAMLKAMQGKISWSKEVRRKGVLLHIHHIEEHQASMFILFLLRKFLETVFLVEGNGRKIGIAEKKFIQVVVTTIKCGQLIVGGQWNKFHRLPAPSDMFVCLGYALLKLPTSLSSLLWRSVLHFQPSHLKVEGVLSLQHRGLSNRSCHSRKHFMRFCVQRYDN